MNKINLLVINGALIMKIEKKCQRILIFPKVYFYETKHTKDLKNS